MVLSLPVRQRRGVHMRRAGFFQRDRARMQGGAGGEDVVDDDVADRRIDGHALGDHEGAGDILAPLLPAEARLGEGLVLLAEEELRATAGDVRGEERRDAFRLVIAAVEPAGGVQRDGH